MTSSELEDFLSEYDAVTSDMQGSTSATFETKLERWFEVVASIPTIDRHIRDLEATVDFDAWRKASEETGGSYMGSQQLRWPKGVQRLAMQMAVLRAMVEGR